VVLIVSAGDHNKINRKQGAIFFFTTYIEAPSLEERERKEKEKREIGNK